MTQFEVDLRKREWQEPETLDEDQVCGVYVMFCLLVCFVLKSIQREMFILIVIVALFLLVMSRYDVQESLFNCHLWQQGIHVRRFRYVVLSKCNRAETVRTW